MNVEISGFTDNSHNGRHPEHTEAVGEDGALQSAKSLLYLQIAGFHIRGREPECLSKNSCFATPPIRKTPCITLCIFTLFTRLQSIHDSCLVKVKRIDVER